MLDAFIASNLLHLTVQTESHVELPCVGSWPDRVSRLHEMLSSRLIEEGANLEALLTPLLRLLSPAQRRRHPPVRDQDWSQFEQEWLPKMQQIAAEELLRILSLVGQVPRGTLCPFAKAMAACRRIKNVALFKTICNLDPDCIRFLGDLAVESLSEVTDETEDLAVALLESGQVDCSSLESRIIDRYPRPRLLLAILRQPPSFSPHWAAAHWMLSRMLTPKDPLFAEFVRWAELACHPLKPRWSIRREPKVILCETFTVAGEISPAIPVGSEAPSAIPAESQKSEIPVKRSVEEWPELHLE